MKTQRIIHPNIDIRKFPEVNADFSMTDISMGDLHANALLFLNILVRQGIIAISPENYAKFAEIYTLPELQADYWGTEAPVFSAGNKQERLEEIKKQYNALIAQIKIINTKKLIRLIGDELVDRGVIDYFILKLLQALHDQGADFEILLSNHGIEFVEACELFKENGNKLVAKRLGNIQHGNSFHALQEAIAAGSISNEEVLNIYHQVYKKHLKIISYALDPDANEIKVFSHAGIGLNHIRGLARKFKVPYSEESAVDLARTIDAINKKFAEKASAGEIHTLYTHDMMYRGYAGEYLNSTDEVVAATVWGREYGDLIRTSKKFKVTFIHGHDSYDPEKVEHVTLNNQLGQFQNNVGDLYLYATNGMRVVPTQCLNPDKKVQSLREKNRPDKPNDYVVKVHHTKPSFFKTAHPKMTFPDSYKRIWDSTPGHSNITKIKALLKDYTKEDNILGSFWGLIFTLHWGRHHVKSVHQIAQTQYTSVEAILSDLKALKPRDGGSLDKRIKFIESQIITQRSDNPDLQFNLK
ncbi:TPA: Dot/Icm T4SS effector WipB [Legionella pneumophila]|uniref:Dot/Icm T4SS effector WipB n=1 Tax=Legionella pneumophila TaxID=446 RepID=UPI000770A4A2|nr:Dot/Icm T4SS effector WipB [Legionella pneumophila]HAT9215733.1 Dot/Icm T4SS effector WipB [Legionella pneumophila subsp. pneumophila]CZI99470.1 Uncharacterised protein [Legionella pneumophila]HAT6820542.1 Dot/Icm T4SS effector WipB [Legionella pneumophila]HAT7778842.1 Dot/Icm T4SS effector WipB [Legionella pneumophila]HAT7782216.1 Dot/Icm T4SS effector WipB [Legionella pneumophila]